ncbi:hypothetical protein AB1N83_005580 [Pleurotus pulmonarius]
MRQRRYFIVLSVGTIIDCGGSSVHVGSQDHLGSAFSLELGSTRHDWSSLFCLFTRDFYESVWCIELASPNTPYILDNGGPALLDSPVTP